MKPAKILTWIAALSLISNVDVHCKNLAECLDTTSKLSLEGSLCIDVKYQFDERSVTCEGDSVTLSCTSGTKLHIQFADYGRFVPGEVLCPNPAINNLNCESLEGSSSIAINICEGMESCTLFASNSVFGDPCPGTYKYLELQYSCW